MLATDKEVPVSFSPLLHRYTLEEFYSLPEPEDRSHFELIGGCLFMVPPPDPPHDDIDSRLVKSLAHFLFTHDIDGDILHPRASIYRNVRGSTYLEPDMMYVSKELKARMGRKRTSADIIFEYVSKSNAVYDRTTKSDTYHALGVGELWLIDPATITIGVRYATVRKDQPAWESRLFYAGDFAESRVLKGWRVSVDELFEGLV